jgi:hypothetical protein
MAISAPLPKRLTAGIAIRRHGDDGGVGFEDFGELATLTPAARGALTPGVPHGGKPLDGYCEEATMPRADATFPRFDASVDFDDIDRDGWDCDGRLTLGSGGAMVDPFPFRRSFRLSGGLRVNGDEARAVATPIAATEINGRLYTPRQIGTPTGGANPAPRSIRRIGKTGRGA